MNSNNNSNNGHHILIVEDSPTQSMLLQHLLEREGYLVTAAASGKQALEALAGFRPSLVISDIVMPEMDGYELSRKIKSDEKLKDMPVILLTALSDPEDVIRGMEALVDFYLTKPYDEDFLLTKVKAIIAHPAQPSHYQGLQRLKISLWGKTHEVSVIPELSLGLLASTYENAIQINQQLQNEIAERKRVEEQLRVTLKRLKEMESIIEISPAVAFVRRAEKDWPIEFVSDNVLQFDYESEDLLSGQIKYMDIVHPQDRDRVLAEVAKYSEDKDVEEFSQEYRINTGYGDTRWVDDRTFVRRNSRGAVTHLQGIILDVTERKRQN